MTKANPNCYHLSASSIAAFKACPTRFRLGYREGLRKAEDTDALRIGTNWHALHEVYRNVWAGFDHEEIGTDEQRHELALDAVIAHLNDAYAERLAAKSPDEWETERQILLTSFVAYLWYYSDDAVEYLCQELPFDLPLHMPRTGLPLPLSEVKRVGKIDHIVRWRNVVGPIERKSTSRNIEPGGDYWERSKKDTQVSMYALAIADMAQAGQLPAELRHTENIGNTIYDVWRRPTMKPAAMSQADTAAFLDTGTYHDQEFSVELTMQVVEQVKTLKSGDKIIPHDVPETVSVDGVPAEVSISKTYKPVLRETPAMFAARLLADMCERPDHYFQRKEIARTDADLRKFRIELFNIYQSQRLMAKHDTWFENEQQCRATFACPYIPVCYGPGADAVCDGATTPDGFKRIFVDPTVNGQAIDEGN